MRFDDTSEYMRLGPATALVESHGATAADAREFVVAALEGLRLPYRVNPPGPAGVDELLVRPAGFELRQQPIDWAASEVAVLDRYAADRYGETWCQRLVPRRARLEVHRGALLQLIDLAGRSRPSFVSQDEATQPELEAAHEVSRRSPPKTATLRRSEAKIRKWAKQYVERQERAGTPSSRDEMLAAARAELGYVDRELIRELKRKLAPRWGKPGPKGKKVPAI